MRFAPFIETGEFANAGVVMIGPQQGFFDFKLLINRPARVTRFFEERNPGVFRKTMRTLHEELTRAATLLRLHGFEKRPNTAATEFARRLFGEIVRPRETILRYSETRAVLADDPKVKLAELYAFYVGRNFVTREYQETVLERSDIDNDDYHVAFPFVERHGDFPVKAIKPLHLAHADSSGILDHDGQWIFRVQTLRRRQLLPAHVLFAVNGPAEDTRRRHAVAEIVSGLESAGIVVAPYTEKQRILEFATAA